MRMRMKQVLLCVVVAYISLLVSCKLEPNSEIVDIHFVTQLPFLDLAPFVSQFEETHPNLRVHISFQMQLPDDWPRKYDAALLSYAPIHFPEQATLLLDLQPLIEVNPSFDVDDYYPGALDLGVKDNQQLAIPIGLNFKVLAFDSRQFVEANAALPQLEWTWAELISSASVIGRHKNELENGGAVFLYDADQGRAKINYLDNSVILYEKHDDRVIPLLDQPDLHAAASELLAMADNLTYEFGPVEYPNEPLRFLQLGSVAMTELDLGEFNRQSARFPDVGITPLPSPNHYGDIGSSDTLVISRGSANPEAVWQWVEFLSKQMGAYVNGDLPARRSVVEASGMWERTDPDVRLIIQTILDRPLHSEPYSKPVQSVYDNLSIALWRVANEGLALDSMLGQAQEEAIAETSQWYENENQDHESEPFAIVPPPKVDGKSLSVRITMRSENEKLYSSQVEDFLENYPGWSVQFVAPTVDSLQTDSVLFEINSYYNLTTLDKESLLTLGAIGELGTPLTKQDFFPQLIEAVSVQGRLIGLPLTVRPLLLYYDSSVFERLNVSPPNSNWTVTDVLEAAEEILDIEPTTDAFVTPTGLDVRFVLEQQGIPLFLQGAFPEPRFSAVSVIEALERLRNLHRGQLILTNLSNPVMQLPVGFGNRPLIGDLAQWDVVALKPYPNTSWPISIKVATVSQQSSEVNMAWEWAVYLATQGTLSSDALPALNSLATSEETRQSLGSDFYEASMLAMERITSVKSNDHSLIEDIAFWWFDQALKKVDEGTDLESTLRDAEVDARSFIDCVALAGSTDRLTLSNCVAQVEPDHWLATSSP